MAGKYLQIVLFVVLQIALVLCRTTRKPEELEKEILTTDEVLRPEALKQTVETGQVTIDDLPIHVAHDYPRTEYQVDSTAVTIVLVIYFVFLISSFVLGCILYYRSKARAVRPGRIVSGNTGVQPFGVKQPNTAM